MVRVAMRASSWWSSQAVLSGLVIILYLACTVKSLDSDCINVMQDLDCEGWAKADECNFNSDWMRTYCGKTCGYCKELSAESPDNKPDEVDVDGGPPDFGNFTDFDPHDIGGVDDIEHPGLDTQTDAPVRVEVPSTTKKPFGQSTRHPTESADTEQTEAKTIILSTPKPLESTGQKSVEDVEEPEPTEMVEEEDILSYTEGPGEIPEEETTEEPILDENVTDKPEQEETSEPDVEGTPSAEMTTLEYKDITKVNVTDSEQEETTVVTVPYTSKPNMTTAQPEKDVDKPEAVTPSTDIVVEVTQDSTLTVEEIEEEETNLTTVVPQTEEYKTKKKKVPTATLR